MTSSAAAKVDDTTTDSPDTGETLTGARRATARRASGRRDPRTGISDQWRKRLEIAVFVTPALVLIGLFIAYPVVSAVRFSLYKWRGVGPLLDFIGLDNYRNVLDDDVFTSAIGHNLFIVVGSIVVQLPLGLAIALLLNRRMRFQGVLRTLIFIPYVLAEVIAGVVWLQLLAPEYGPLDALSKTVGLTPPDQGWLGTPGLALWTVLIVLTWKYLGLAILLFLAGMQSISPDLYEAAQLDGATWWQVQRKITIPLLGPTIRTWIFLSMIGSLQVFDMVWILTPSSDVVGTSTMATYLVGVGNDKHNVGRAGAASVILFGIAFTMAALYQFFVLRRDTKADYKPLIRLRRGVRV